MAAATNSARCSLSAAFSSLSVVSSSRSRASPVVRSPFMGSAVCHSSATFSVTPVVISKNATRENHLVTVKVEAKEGYKCKTHKVETVRIEVSLTQVVALHISFDKPVSPTLVSVISCPFLLCEH